jgi:hypothetical protein
MAFAIKNSNMYFKQIVDHSSIAGYLDRKHPVKTFEFKASQSEAMKFKNYGEARKYMKENGLSGNIIEITVSSPFHINKMEKNIGPNRLDAWYDSVLLKTRDDIEEMIADSENNFKHMARDILKVRTVTLNVFLRNPYEIGWQTRKKIMDRLEDYFEGAGMK